MTNSLEIDKLLKEESRYIIEAVDALSFYRYLPDNLINLVIGSPFYCTKACRYPGLPKQSDDIESWIQFMLDLSKEAVRICSGDVIWIVNSPFKKGNYIPAVE